VSAILSAGKVHHTIDAGEGGTSTAVSVRVELLLGQNVAARLEESNGLLLDDAGCRIQLDAWGRSVDKERVCVRGNKK
jgi:hypothetical protein